MARIRANHHPSLKRVPAKKCRHNAECGAMFFIRSFALVRVIRGRII
jgi:hypothetical protein